MINHRLWQELDKVAARDRVLRFWSALAAAWLLASVVGFGLWTTGLAPAGNARVAVPLLCGVGLAVAAVCLALARASAPNYLAIARRIETAYPDLHSCLLAALEQQPSLHTGRFGFLQESVIGEALVHADRHAWRDIVPSRRMKLAVSAQFMTLALFVCSLIAAAFWVSPATISAATKQKRHGGQAGEEMSFTVEPGNTEIERGSSLLVLARVSGPLPAEATLVFESAGEANRTEMSSSLDDPVFGARIAAVNEPLDYHVELDGKSSAVFHVSVFEYPRLERADARLVYPRYTGLEDRLVQDFRTLSVVEGTELTIICHLNKRVASAALTEKGAEPLVLAPADAEHADYQATFRAEQSRRLKLELVDDAGRANLVKSELSIQVVVNKPPTIKPVFPARDYEVSPLEELDLKATIWDDFGVARFGVSYAMAGEPPVDLVLGEKAAAKQKHELGTRIDFEKLHAQPDQLLSYYFWAEDFDGAGNLRRTSGDMYFAEVRQFDEIFRQGQAPAGGQQQQQQQQGGQNAQAAQQLAQLQKDIMNATWKLIRREIGARLTDGFAADTGEVAQSQSTAREQAEALAEKLRDSQSLEHLTAVLESMERAVQHLEAAQSEPSPKPLQPALAAEQAAYQGLLRLRAREHEVVRQQQRSSSSQANASARSQQQRQQLNQLELKNEENRYETQREARSQPEQQADREARQVLNRLRELARRQHDLNERLKDLQSALQEAQTAEKKEEIRRQLKRLEEEQTQVLRDTDELASRMESPENQEQMSEQRQQLEQTRDQVRRTSEALEQQQVTQAAASGTRAEREFEELRNEFRRRASGRFNEQMLDMREAARELERREQELGQKLAPSSGSESTKKSLRDEGNRREDLPREIADQRQRLSQLTEQMRETIQEAEQTEPLLSERLYEAARTAQDQNIDRALDAANRSLRQGLVDDARQLERAANKGVEKLREGVEKAAEAVLGDEGEALRRAREELQNLSRELNQEISRNAPDGPQPRSPRGNSQAGQQNRTGTGEPGDEQQQAREAQGEPREGERQATENQPGREQQGQPRDGQQSRNGRGQRGQRGQQPGERQPGERQPRQNQPADGQPGERQPGERQQSEQQPGEQQPGNQQGRQPGQPRQNGQGQRGGQQPGQAQDGQPQPGERQPGQNQANDPREAQRGGQRGNPNGPRLRAGNQAGGATGGDEDYRDFAPIAGADFLNWSDRLRDVEEMVDDPELRAEAARIRDRARSIRAEFKRHSKAPNWDLVRMQVAEPLVELTDRVAEEVLRRNSRQAIVPLDRDPVPPKYSEKTRKYYEQLFRSRIEFSLSIDGSRLMPLAEIVTGAPRWLGLAIPLVILAAALVIWSYSRARSRTPLRVVAAAFKWTGILILAACLVEPLINTTRPRPGSNLFLVVADNSRSLQLADAGHRESRGKEMQAHLADQTPWLARLGQDFDLRRYVFDTALRPVTSFGELTLDGEASALSESLSALADRFRGQPVAGILLLTDGNATDLGDAVRDWKGLPPVYPVPIGTDTGLVDLSVSHVAVSQTNFEAAPVTITASIEGRSVAGKEVGVRVVDENDKELERRDKLTLVEGEPLVERFLLRPERPGINFFSVQAFLKGEEQLPAKPGATREATLANNRRIATVDRGGGPYRVLYVGGRPNWEFKFLRRALDEDDEVHLVGLVRIAKREPTFKFLGRSGERTNPLFRGFGNQADEQAEQYDQPVLIRLHTEDKDELRGGFPKSADDLFRYHAVIIDDVEAAFFTQDQLSLLQQFVSRRGGGLLMLGGKDSFFEGGYQRGAVGEMLPVYLDRAPDSSSAAAYRLLLTREGWLQPWVRVRTNETDERQRLGAMPEFKSVNRIERIKPGAQVLAQVASADGAESPALVVQQFGRGRTAAMLVGDLWRWHLRRADPAESDLEKSWRQTVRWLVSDVPGRVEVETRRVPGAAVPTVQIAVRARDKQFELLDNAAVTLRVETPDKRQIELIAEASDAGPGRYEATFAARTPGVYRGQVSVTAPDGSEVGRRETGWSVEPQTEEFRTLSVNRALLETIARETEGEIVPADELDEFVAGLPNRKIPIVETKPFELWHRWQVLLAAMTCLVVEWGLRRWKGMP